MSESKILLFLVQFFTGYLLQGFSFPLFVFAYSKKRIDDAHYVITALLMTLFIFISRNLNINFGVHTIVNLVLLIVLSTFYCKISINKSTVGSLLVTVSMMIIELINVGLMMLIFTPEVFKVQVKDPLWNALTAIPATTALLIVSFILYRLRCRGVADAQKSS